MSKRGNENSQMRREKVDALDDEESSGGGAFERATPEVLAQRRIIKVKRPTGDGPPRVLNFGVADNFASSTVGGAPAQSNPFGGFKGLSADATVAASTAPANPFGGFTGLIAPAPVAAANPFGGFTAPLSTSVNWNVPGLSAEAKSIGAPEVLAQRRIIKVKRPTGDGPPKVLNFGVADNFASSTVGGAPAQSNPFEEFKGPTAPFGSLPAVTANSFSGGFTGVAPVDVADAEEDEGKPILMSEIVQRLYYSGLQLPVT